MNTKADKQKILTNVRKNDGMKFNEIKRSIGKYNNEKGGAESLKKLLTEMVAESLLTFDESGVYSIKDNVADNGICGFHVPYGKNTDISFIFESNKNGISLRFNGGQFASPDNAGSNNETALSDDTDFDSEDTPFDMDAPFEPEPDNRKTTTAPTIDDNGRPF